MRRGRSLREAIVDRLVQFTLKRSLKGIQFHIHEDEEEDAEENSQSSTTTTHVSHKKTVAERQDDRRAKLMRSSSNMSLRSSFAGAATTLLSESWREESSMQLPQSPAPPRGLEHQSAQRFRKSLYANSSTNSTSSWISGTPQMVLEEYRPGRLNKFSSYQDIVLVKTKSATIFEQMNEDEEEKPWEDAVPLPPPVAWNECDDLLPGSSHAPVVQEKDPRDLRASFLSRRDEINLLSSGSLCS